MSDSKEFNEANENDLEQVAGGRVNVATYVCPVCGYTDREFYKDEIELNHPHYCLPCGWDRKHVEMIRQ